MSNNIITYDSWIDDACEWLENYYVDYLIEGARIGLDIEAMVKDFKKDMSELPPPKGRGTSCKNN